MFRAYKTLWSAVSMAVGFIEHKFLSGSEKAYDNHVIYILLYSQLNPFRTAFDPFYNGYVSQVSLLTFCFMGTYILVYRCQRFGACFCLLLQTALPNYTAEHSGVPQSQ